MFFSYLLLVFLTRSRFIQFLFLFQDLKGTLAQELDFENEGRNGERCYRELKHLNYVHVPQIFWDKTSKVRLYEVISGMHWLGFRAGQIFIQVPNSTKDVFISENQHSYPGFPKDSIL